MKRLIALIAVSLTTLTPSQFTGLDWQALTANEQHIYTLGFANGMYATSAILITELRRTNYLTPQQIRELALFLDSFQQTPVRDLKYYFNEATASERITRPFANDVLNRR